MDTKFGNTTIRLIRGDLTVQSVDAVINAANSSLLGGGGVDGAIHRAGGPEILDACREIVADIGSLRVGKAVITTSGKLPAGFVIHTVGPIYRGGTHGENSHLEQAYRNSLELARDEGLGSVAFPSISTGAYNFPIEEAAAIALNTIARFCRENPESLEEIRLVLFSQSDFEVYASRLDLVLRTTMG